MSSLINLRPDTCHRGPAHPPQYVGVARAQAEFPGSFDERCRRQRPELRAAVRFAALFQFGSAVPLGISAATVYAQQLWMSVRVSGPAISFFDARTASALLVWVWVRPEISADPSLCQALAFLAGGVAFVVCVGPLVARTTIPDGLLVALVTVIGVPLALAGLLVWITLATFVFGSYYIGRLVFRAPSIP